MGSGHFGEVLAAAKLAAIHEIITRLPSGYDTKIGEGAVGLSGSERRRIELARAIYGRPRLLVLDEPAAFLDRTTRRALEAAVADLKRTGRPWSSPRSRAKPPAGTAWRTRSLRLASVRSGVSEVGRPRPAARARPMQPTLRRPVHMSLGRRLPRRLCRRAAGPPFGLGADPRRPQDHRGLSRRITRLVPACPARERGGRARRCRRRQPTSRRCSTWRAASSRRSSSAKAPGPGRRPPDPAAEHPARVRPERGPGGVLRGARHRGPPGGRARRQAAIDFPEELGAGWATRRCRMRSPARRASSSSRSAIVAQQDLILGRTMAGLEAQIGASRARSPPPTSSIALIDDELTSALALQEQGSDDQVAVLALQKDRAEFEGDDQRATSPKSARRGRTSRRPELRMPSCAPPPVSLGAEELRMTRARAYELAQKLAAAADVMGRTEIRLPIDGTVVALKVHTIGGVVIAGEPLLDIVRANDELWCRPRSTRSTSTRSSRAAGDRLALGAQPPRPTRRSRAASRRLRRPPDRPEHRRQPPSGPRRAPPDLPELRSCHCSPG